MMPRHPSPVTSAARWLLAAAVASVSLVAVASPAAAAPRVTVTNAAGDAVADLSASTQVTVSGTGFQSIAGGFGGIYVFFGWVDDPSGGTWAPSKGGATGTDYLYVPDTEAQQNQGYERFVSFPGSDTASAANGGVVDAAGSWSLTMTIPGPTFEAVDRNGDVAKVDCTKKTCGIITVGAHGVTNANNESFTPVAFADLSGAGAGSAAAPASAQADPAVAAVTTPATIGVEQSSITAGRVLTFTGQGFLPGEQVVGSLAGGLAGVGPLTAGSHGEVAGVLALPADLRIGTHTLTLVGAASGQSPTIDFQVVADTAAVAAAASADDPVERRTSIAAVVVGVVALVLLGLLVASAVTAAGRRRAARAAAARGGARPESGAADADAATSGVESSGPGSSVFDSDAPDPGDREPVTVRHGSVAL